MSEDAEVIKSPHAMKSSASTYAAREAYHAGSWYAADAGTLQAQLEGWLAEARSAPVTGVTVDAPDDAGNDDDRSSLNCNGSAPSEQVVLVNTRVKALIAPHAGYAYSGPTAAYAYRFVSAEAYDQRSAGGRRGDPAPDAAAPGAVPVDEPGHGRARALHRDALAVCSARLSRPPAAGARGARHGRGAVGDHGGARRPGARRVRAAAAHAVRGVQRFLSLGTAFRIYAWRGRRRGTRAPASRYAATRIHSTAGYERYAGH
eukprot:ctg_2078.g531